MKNFIATAIVFATITSSPMLSMAKGSSDAPESRTETKVPARKVDANNVHTSSNAFGVGMYQIKNTESFKLLVETTSKLTMKVTDSKGNVLNREALKNSSALNINLSDAPAGTYFVEVSNGTETITRQITKKGSDLSAQ